MTARPAVTKVVGVTYADCRLLGHSWDSYTPLSYEGVFRNVLHLRCERCGTCRHDSFDSYGNLGQRKYDHPDDYRLAVDEKPTREQLRLGTLKTRRR